MKNCPLPDSKSDKEFIKDKAAYEVACMKMGMKPYWG
jgi:hypothetical protein